MLSLDTDLPRRRIREWEAISALESGLIPRRCAAEMSDLLLSHSVALSLSVCMSLSLSVSLSLCVCLSVCLSLVPINLPFSLTHSKILCLFSFVLFYLPNVSLAPIFCHLSLSLSQSFSLVPLTLSPNLFLLDPPLFSLSLSPPSRSLSLSLSEW